MLTVQASEAINNMVSGTRNLKWWDLDPVGRGSPKLRPSEAPAIVETVGHDTLACSAIHARPSGSIYSSPRGSK